jgi:RNA polymerase sigma-70 factor (ECF subfamily)
MFASLYERHEPQVAAYCRRRADADQVDDLVAEVFLTAWRKIDNAPDNEVVLRWLYRIAYLVLTNHWRSEGRHKKLRTRLESLGVQYRELVADQVVMRSELRDVLRAASRLRFRDQEILRLSLWEHLSHDEIAAVLDITANTAKQRLHRARGALVKEYGRITKSQEVTPAAWKGGEW